MVLQCTCASADPLGVTIGAASAPTARGGLGVTAVQERMQAIRRQISARSVGGAAFSASPHSTSSVSFADQLQRAASNAGLTVDDADTAGADQAAALVGTIRANALGVAAKPSAPAAGPVTLNTVRPTELPAVPVTAAMRAAGNGQLPDSVLSSIGDGHRLAEPAASAFLAMRKAAAADGVTFGVNDAYRSYDEQVDLAAREGIYGQGGLAAVPGTSNHGWGLATDLDLSDAAHAWMADNAWRYGFFEDVPGESWHWTYRSS